MLFVINTYRVFLSKINQHFMQGARLIFIMRVSFLAITDRVTAQIYGQESSRDLHGRLGTVHSTSQVFQPCIIYERRWSIPSLGFRSSSPHWLHSLLIILCLFLSFLSSRTEYLPHQYTLLNLWRLG